MGRVYIFEHGSNPSTDYYIIQALSYAELKPIKVDMNSNTYPELEEGSLVAIVRYANRRFMKYLTENRKKISRLIYFMDDGLWDMKSLLSLPPLYAFRIFKRAYLFRSAILKLGAEVWVSTDYLGKKYRKYNPKVIYPYPIGLENVSMPESDLKVVFYHGTSSHKEEFRWLRSFLKLVSEKLSDALFEVILDNKNAKLFKGIPNLVPIRPMGWKAFYRFSSLRYRSVGLVPLFDTEFNRGRSWVKFYDITRSGAVGIYSEHASYAGMIKEFGAGVVLPMDEKLWLEALEELLRNERKRRELFEGALKLVDHLRKKAEESYRRALS